MELTSRLTGLGNWVGLICGDRISSGIRARRRLVVSQVLYRKGFDPSVTGTGIPPGGRGSGFDQGNPKRRSQTLPGRPRVCTQVAGAT